LWDSWRITGPHAKKSSCLPLSLCNDPTNRAMLAVACAINKPEPVLRLAKSVFTGKNGVHRRVLAAAGAQPTDRMCRFRLWMGQVWQIPDPPLENLVSFLSMGFDAV
jgi:hypothetical protein